MTLSEKLDAAGVVEGMRLCVTFFDGRSMTGLFTGYTFADDNEEGVASIDLRIEKGEPEYCLYEDEIDTIELA